MSSDHELRHTKLVQYIAKVAYPGYGEDGRFDVESLRYRCVARRQPPHYHGLGRHRRQQLSRLGGP